MIEGNNSKSFLSTSEIGDRVSAAENLIVVGARLKDGLMIKIGINLLKSVGYPFHFIITIARYLVRVEAKK